MNDVPEWVDRVTPITQYPGWRPRTVLVLVAMLGLLCLAGFLLSVA